MDRSMRAARVDRDVGRRGVVGATHQGERDDPATGGIHPNRREGHVLAGGRNVARASNPRPGVAASGNGWLDEEVRDADPLPWADAGADPGPEQAMAVDDLVHTNVVRLDGRRVAVSPQLGVAPKGRGPRLLELPGRVLELADRQELARQVKPRMLRLQGPRVRERPEGDLVERAL